MFGSVQGDEMNLVGLACVCLLSGLTALPFAANAADFGTAVTADAPPSREWTLTVGGYVMSRPEFLGSADNDWGFMPLISITRADRLSRFTSFNDSPSIALYDSGTFEAGVAANMVWKRERSDNWVALQGLRNIDYAYELGGYAQVFPVDWLRVRGEVFYGFGGYEGVFANFAADAIAFTDFWGGMTFSAGPRLELASSGFVDTYYGITVGESIATGGELAPYDAKGGLYSVGLGGQIQKNFGNGFNASIFGEYRYLLGDAQDSPLVVQRGDPNQFTAGVSLSYTFFLGFE
ncbi:MipA/OmpV family protein [Ancylobacter terrae]|uniref:MipA/OmpV family protein n=1 Tax=Ancylobacter sp. sgz301288 TaxID=3342077 RepID=UPI003858F775